MSQSLTERYDDRIGGILSCYDRLVITGTLPGVCYAAGMAGYLNAKGIRIFDYPEFAKTLRDRVRDRAASLAAEAGIAIEHIANGLRTPNPSLSLKEQVNDSPTPTSGQGDRGNRSRPLTTCGNRERFWLGGAVDQGRR